MINDLSDDPSSTTLLVVDLRIYRVLGRNTTIESINPSMMSPTYIAVLYITLYQTFLSSMSINNIENAINANTV